MEHEEAAGEDQEEDEHHGLGLIETVLVLRGGQRLAHIDGGESDRAGHPPWTHAYTKCGGGRAGVAFGKNDVALW